MPRVLQTTTAGVLVEQDDGTVTLLPPDLAPQDAGAPPQADLQAGAPAAPPAPRLTTGLADAGVGPQAESPVPDVAKGPNAPGPTPPLPDAISGAAPVVDTGPVGGQAQGATETRGLAPAPETPSPSGVSGAPPPLDPYEQQAVAAEAAGVAAADNAAAQAAKQQAAADAAAGLAAKRAEAQQRIMARQAELLDAHTKAVDEQAKFDVRSPKSSTLSTVGKVIALAFGTVGSALSRQGGDNPVLGVLERRAQEAANERMRQYSKLGDRVNQTEKSLDILGRVATSQDAYYNLSIANEWEKYARESDQQALLLGGQEALLRGQAQSAAFRAKRDEAAGKAAQQAFENERDAAKIALDQYSATEAVRQRDASIAVDRSNAGTARGRLKFDVESRAQARQDAAAQQAFENTAKMTELADKLARSKSGTAEQQRAAEFEYKKAQDAISKQIPALRPVAVKDADGKVTGVVLKPLTFADGRTFEAKTPERAKELSKKLEASQQYIDAIDRLQTLREQNGSEWFKTADARKAMINYKTAVVRKKDAFGLGALSGPDQEIAEGAIGTDNPNEWRGIGDALLESRNRELTDINISLRNEGYDNPEPFDIPNLTSQGLRSKADEGPAGSLVRQISAARVGGTLEDRLRRGAGSSGIDVIPPGIPSYADKVDPLIEMAKGGDPSAVAGLANLAKQDAFVALRALRSGVDLSQQMTPEEWARATKALGVVSGDAFGAGR